MTGGVSGWTIFLAMMTGLALRDVLVAISPPWWLRVLIAAAVAVTFVLVWALTSPPARQLCHMCARGIHPHEYHDGRCIAAYCECDEDDEHEAAASVPAAAGGRGQ